MIRKLLLSTLALLALHGSCFAAGEEKLLENYQKMCYKMVDIFDGGTVPTYADLEPIFSDALKAKFNSLRYGELVKAIADRYGTVTGMRFALFERLEDTDRVAFLADFPKSPEPVLVGFVFDANGKLDAFVISSKKAQPKGK